MPRGTPSPAASARHHAAADPAVGVLEALARRARAEPAAPGPSQPARSGHASQRGARAVHTVAPSSIVAWLKSAARPGGGTSAAPSRAKSRRALVSSATSWRPNANEPTAAAV